MKEEQTEEQMVNDILIEARESIGEEKYDKAVECFSRLSANQKESNDLDMIQYTLGQLPHNFMKDVSTKYVEQLAIAIEMNNLILDQLQIILDTKETDVDELEVIAEKLFSDENYPNSDPICNEYNLGRLESYTQLYYTLFHHVNKYGVVVQWLSGVNQTIDNTSLIATAVDKHTGATLQLDCLYTEGSKFEITLRIPQKEGPSFERCIPYKDDIVTGVNTALVQFGKDINLLNTMYSITLELKEICNTNIVNMEYRN